MAAKRHRFMLLYKPKKDAAVASASFAVLQRKATESPVKAEKKLFPYN
jgi:hypothetical protein